VLIFSIFSKLALLIRRDDSQKVTTTKSIVRAQKVEKGEPIPSLNELEKKVDQKNKQ
jgi:hypothetical protein